MEQGECSDDEKFYALAFEAAPQYKGEIMTFAQRLMQRGVQEGIEKTAVNMLVKGFSMVDIAEITGFDQEKMNELIESSQSAVY